MPRQVSAQRVQEVKWTCKGTPIGVGGMAGSARGAAVRPRRCQVRHLSACSVGSRRTDAGARQASGYSANLKRNSKVLDFVKRGGQHIVNGKTPARDQSFSSTANPNHQGHCPPHHSALQVHNLKNDCRRPASRISAQPDCSTSQASLPSAGCHQVPTESSW